MNVWLTIGAAGLVTFATRLSFIFLLGRFTAPPWFTRALRYVPVAVLSAIIVPETITYQGAVDLSWRNPQIWAAAVAILVALRVKNVLVIIGAGMAALLLFRWLLAAIWQSRPGRASEAGVDCGGCLTGSWLAGKMAERLSLPPIPLSLGIRL